MVRYYHNWLVFVIVLALVLLGIHTITKHNEEE